MSQPLRFTTVRVGTISVTGEGHTFEFDVRVLLGSDGAYRLLSGTLSEPVPTEEEAVHLLTSDVEWRDGVAVLEPEEQPCAICGAPVTASARYPRKLCLPCVLEATDADGRSLQFSNTGPFGGFEARHRDDKSPYPGGECFVRGIRCQAEEGRFGGIVVQPLGY